VSDRALATAVAGGTGLTAADVLALPDDDLARIARPTRP